MGIARRKVEAAGRLRGRSKCNRGITGVINSRSSIFYSGRKRAAHGAGVSPKAVAAAAAVAALLLISGCGKKPPPNVVHAPEEVSGRIIGTIEGSPAVVLAEDLGVSKPFSTGSELMYNLTAGTLDCVIMEKSAAEELVAATSGVRILSQPLLEYDLHFAVAKENAELLRAVNSALTVLRGDGTLNNLRDKYFSGKKYTYVPPTNIASRPGSLSLAIPPDSPPYSYVNNDGEYAGLDIEVARAVCDQLGVELKIIEFDARDLVTSVWFGKADLALGWIPGEGEDKVAVSDTYANAVLVVIVRK